MSSDNSEYPKDFKLSNEKLAEIGNFLEIKTNERLYSEIYKALPDLMELGVGCQMRLKDTDTFIFTCFSVKKCCRFIDQHGTSYAWDEDDLKESKFFEILGKPITLPDVLRWMDKLGVTWGEYLVYSEIYNIEKLLELWDLTIPNLYNQSQEVKDFLEKLKTDQK